MSFRAALSALAGMSVSGVSHNYDIDVVPDALNRGQLPALLVWPIDMQEDRLFKDQGAGFHAMAFGSGTKSVTLTVTHLLLVAPTGSGIGVRSHFPALVTLMDAYLTAFAADVTLSDTLAEPARIRVEPGVFPVGDVSYYGCAFRHTWILDI